MKILAEQQKKEDFPLKRSPSDVFFFLLSHAPDFISIQNVDVFVSSSTHLRSSLILFISWRIKIIVAIWRFIFFYWVVEWVSLCMRAREREKESRREINWCSSQLLDLEAIIGSCCCCCNRYTGWRQTPPTIKWFTGICAFYTGLLNVHFSIRKMRHRKKSNNNNNRLLLLVVDASQTVHGSAHSMCRMMLNFIC